MALGGSLPQINLGVQSVTQGSHHKTTPIHSVICHGQVTRMTPELTHIPCSDFHTTPGGGHLSLDRFNEHRIPQYAGSSGALGSNHSPAPSVGPCLVGYRGHEIVRKNVVIY
ncbi:hypothetical protein TNCV_2553561 [Trichonephila clavipes]|nr:hypothetical protein TNCV_2553561 [Trichonephila clavipes]